VSLGISITKVLSVTFHATAEDAIKCILIHRCRWGKDWNQKRL